MSRSAMDADFAAIRAPRVWTGFALSQCTSLTVFYMQPLDDHEPGKENRFILILRKLPNIFLITQQTLTMHAQSPLRMHARKPYTYE